MGHDEAGLDLFGDAARRAEARYAQAVGFMARQTLDIGPSIRSERRRRTPLQAVGVEYGAGLKSALAGRADVVRAPWCVTGISSPSAVARVKGIGGTRGLVSGWHGVRANGRWRHWQSAY